MSSDERDRERALERDDDRPVPEQGAEAFLHDPDATRASAS